MNKTSSIYTLDDFDYELPRALIAQEPARPRDHSRLLVYDRRTGEIVDDHFYNLADHLPRQTTLVANNSRVEKCRLLFEDGNREIFVLRALDHERIEALVRPGKRFRPGKRVRLADGIEAEVLTIGEEGVRTLRLNRPLDHPSFDPYRVTPFPPYIEQDETLAHLYQTVYARDEGSKAAPTAGLHFTDSLIRKLEARGVAWEEVTLHVGLGTFAPVKTDHLEEHDMHSEWYQLEQDTADALNRASHLTAVGTTSVRVLESVLQKQSKFSTCSGDTDIFITPGYKFKAVDAVITNFHLPKSTLLMLVAAFIGLEKTKEIYRYAVDQKYRFYSFGDAMLLK